MSVNHDLAFRLETRAAQPVLALRGQTAVTGLSDFFSHAFGAVLGALAELGEQPVGPPYACYHSMDMRALDVEAGFPVARPLPPGNELIARELPAGEVATALHVGPYEQVARTYGALSAWLREQGLAPGGDAWECYLNSPQDTPPERLETLVVFPVTRPA